MKHLCVHTDVGGLQPLLPPLQSTTQVSEDTKLDCPVTQAAEASKERNGKDCTCNESWVKGVYKAERRRVSYYARQSLNSVHSQVMATRHIYMMTLQILKAATPPLVGLYYHQGVVPQ